MDSRGLVPRVHGQLVHRQVPARQLDGGLSPGGAAQRKDAGDERNLADGDAIHEIRTAAVDGVLDLDHVLPVLRDLEEEDRIGMEVVVVVVGQLVPVGIVQRQRGLEPAGHGVGQVGDQFPRAGGDDQPLALSGLEAVAVRVAGREPLGLPVYVVRLAGNDLPVDHGRQRNIRRHLGREAERAWEVLRFRDEPRLLLAELGQPAHAEPDRVRQSPRRLRLSFPAGPALRPPRS